MSPAGPGFFPRMLQSTEIHDIFQQAEQWNAHKRPACFPLLPSSFDCIQPK
jgi:hypothetical protein